MIEYTIHLPSQPKVIREEDNTGVYEIDGLYPGYGHTLGNSLRRIILSSLPGSAITSVKIDGAEHEFSTIDGVKEDVVTILLNLKKVRIKMLTDEPQTLTLKAKGIGDVSAKDIEIPGQVEIVNGDQHIASLTTKGSALTIEMRVEKGIGYIPKEILEKDRVDIGTIALDAIFAPIKRVNYEVENMRVGDRTDFNRLRISVETDGIVAPREALEKSIEIMINQLKAIVGFQEESMEDIKEAVRKEALAAQADAAAAAAKERMGRDELDTEVLKTRIEELGLSSRTMNALAGANIRTVGGLVRKKAEDILAIEGMGEKGLEEIKTELQGLGLGLRD